MANLDVAEAFYAEGGTEFAPMSTTSSLEVWEIGRSPADHQQPRGRRLPSQLHLHVSCTASLFSATAPLQLDCSHTLGECIRDPPPPPPPPPEVAIAYALGGGSGGLRGRRALLFKLRANSFIDRGADLSYCSCFAAEAEVCYPPLTFLAPSGRREAFEHGGVTFEVVEVLPSFSS